MSRANKAILYSSLFAAALLFALPLYLVLAGSLSGSPALNAHYKALPPQALFAPAGLTLAQYDRFLVSSVGYLDKFWNSVILSLSIAAGQTFISLCSGYLFAKVDFRFKRGLFTLYVLVMMMPYQVSILPTYILSRRVGLYDTWWALLLPGFFAPFGVFLMRQFTRSLPDEVIEAAKLETGSLFTLLGRIVAPMMAPGLVVCFVLSFSESWGMVEQPLILLAGEKLQPLSLMLNDQRAGDLGLSFAGSVLYALPALFVYLLSRDKLMNRLGDL